MAEQFNEKQMYKNFLLVYKDTATSTNHSCTLKNFHETTNILTILQKSHLNCQNALTLNNFVFLV